MDARTLISLPSHIARFIDAELMEAKFFESASSAAEDESPPSRYKPLSYRPFSKLLAHFVVQAGMVLQRPVAV